MISVVTFTSCSGAPQNSALIDVSDSPSGFVLYEPDSVERTHNRPGSVKVIYKRPDKPDLETLHVSRDFACADGQRNIVHISRDDTTDTISTKMSIVPSSEALANERENFLGSVPATLLEMIDKYEADNPERRKYDAVSQNSLTDYVKVENGFFAGFNAGEWGGSMMWFANEGEPRVVSGENTNNIVKVGDRIFVAQGYVHLGTVGHGSISVYQVQGDFWKSETGFLKSDIILPAAVSKILFHDGLIIGLMGGTPVFVQSDGAVSYSRYWKERKVQNAKSIAIDKDKRIWIGGENQIGIWSDPANPTSHKLYVRNDCAPQDHEVIIRTQ